MTDGFRIAISRAACSFRVRQAPRLEARKRSFEMKQNGPVFFSVIGGGIAPLRLRGGDTESSDMLSPTSLAARRAIAASSHFVSAVASLCISPDSLSRTRTASCRTRQLSSLAGATAPWQSTGGSGGASRRTSRFSEKHEAFASKPLMRERGRDKAQRLDQALTILARK